jgi:predicted phosphodiesterase
LRVAALYDVHGNLPALDAVLAEVDADAIVVGGDSSPARGRRDARAAALARRDVRFIRGNADREVVEERQGLAPPELMEFVRDGSRGAARLSPLAAADRRRSGVVSSAMRRRGTTRRSSRESVPDERWREALAGVDAGVVVCGHTHVQFDRQIGEVRLVNAGSVGMPYADEPGAYWALLDGTDVELRHTRCQAPDVSEWPGEWPQASADEATEFFEKLSREQS